MANNMNGADGMLTGSKSIRVVVSCLVFLLGTVLTGETATLGSHYPFGGEGVMAGSAPPPGFHYRIYNTWYNPTTLKDNNGDTINNGFELDVFASVHRFVHVTNVKILGADLIYDVIVPMMDKDISIRAINYSDSKSFTVGDVVLEPFVLAWHKPRWDATVGLGIIIPTGEYDATKLASPGLGYWSGMLTVGGTYYLDDKKSWSISALTRTLIHTEQQDTNVTPGSELVVEYGIGKDIAINNNLLVRPGLTGCAYWQLGDDSDDALSYNIRADERKKANAIGAEINFFWLPQLLQLNLRVLREYGAENTAEGSQFVATLTKSW